AFCIRASILVLRQMNQLPQGVSGCNAEITKESTNTRRWPRFQVQLPVLITVETEGSKVSISGLLSEVSRSGMAVYAGVNAQPGELIHADFRPSTKLRIASVVRSRSGHSIGLDF